MTTASFASNTPRVIVGETNRVGRNWVQTTMSGRKALIALAVAVVLMRSHNEIHFASLKGGSFAS